MSIPENITITKIEGANLIGTRPRVIGRNSHIFLNAQKITEPVVRLTTNEGIIGWGWSEATEADARPLLGKSLHEIFDAEKGTTEDFLKFDFPMWDLAGQVTGQSVHAILGDVGPNPVPVYDGSIYIDELDPDTGRDDGIQPMLDAVQMGMDAGFRGFKVKIGRGFKWMETRAGLQRDADVLHAIRDKIGPDMKLLIDANNGYTPEGAQELMQQVGECDIFWFEEPFPETTNDCIAFKSFMKEQGWNTLLADGETRSRDYTDTEFEQIVRAGGIDVVQLDLRYYTITRWLRFMPTIKELGILTAPHNWGSHLSGFYIPQFARGVGHFAMGETDTMTMPSVTADGYELKDSLRSVPDTPGFGLQLDEEAFLRAKKEDGWTVD